MKFKAHYFSKLTIFDTKIKYLNKKITNLHNTCVKKSALKKKNIIREMTTLTDVSIMVGETSISSKGSVKSLGAFFSLHKRT